MRTRMPFNTEAERKSIRGVSWRQATYILFAALVYLSIASEILFSGRFTFIVGFVLCALTLPITAPFLILAFLKNGKSGYYYDQHLIFLSKFKKSQTGIWRQ
ncbi:MULTISPECIES: PrgI family protein [Bacillaceae]|uniref:PrgI family protein n=1 Tax=Metabacillus endolithicus TaxID=1535204 RepID=A0ABW5C2F6_9BACI|nr:MULTISPECIES: PrgI family protein [Bacillaceae]PGT84634.1 hypothetical protein COD11_10450 [Bacillus sp. AFS040349]UGB33682.1 PrgI family protein [Metabacillus sp. B2-18]UPG66079.1 PrgI family protein [Metabacillus endolithicus]